MMNKTNRTIALVSRFLAVGFLVFLIGGTQVWARGGGRGGGRSGGSRGSVRHSSPSRSRSTPTRAQPSSQRSYSSRDASPSRTQDRTRASSQRTYSTRDTAPSRTPDRTRPSTGRTPDRTRPATGGDRNVNVNRDVNVNVNRGGHHHHDWNDARRDWMRYRTVNHLIRAGTYWATYPRYSTTVVVYGSSYYYWGGLYYVSSGSGYVVVSPPPTAVVYAIPVAATPVYAGSTTYYYYGGTYYVPTTKPADVPKGTEDTVTADVSADASGGQTKKETMDTPEMTKDDSNYEVVAPPVGATVPYLPDEAKEETVGGKKYFLHDKTYYRPFSSDGETIYMVVEKPKK
ncbi:MAG: DUF6515 family protein [Planctomycetota bacterium]